MKKLLIIMIAFLCCATDAFASPFHHRISHHRPAIVLKHSHKHHVEPLVVAAAGVIGYAFGNAIASSRPVVNQNYTVYEPAPQKCFVVVSQSTGKVTRRCVNGDYNDEVLYVD